ncbi:MULTISPECIES: DNA polymerase I [Sorangium]|uniref:DNA polymerase I n=1 Tax=Sorangium cellulosum TaxID=56 RepID=A0A4P2R4S8_SORCE|nr:MULTISPECIES: DNA polymerase I [Sorangium]AUX38055.1 DNA polymerase I [Sorangium cellulosum]WCQ97342.1 DNA polymerase I [Sorangium sp. Soce836]
MSTRPTALPPAGAPDVLYLIDLSGYVFRAYHAISPLSSPSGEPTHATYGTVAMLSKLVDERKPAYLGVAMDSPGKTFRDDLDPRYKAHRPPPPPDLGVQMNRCREIVEAYCIPIFIQEGLEADDLVAVAVARAKERGLRVVIASSDKDLMQLVDGDRVMLWDAMRDKVYGHPEVVAKFGVPPEQVRDLLALVGDSSDNVPGVPGVGLKTAAELLAQFGSLSAIYARLDEVKKPRIRESLKQHEADALLSQKLVTLDGSAPVSLDLETLRYGGADTGRLRELFTELGFSRFLKAVRAPELTARASTYRVVATREELEAFAKSARAAGRLAIDVHATSREPMSGHVCGIALACEPGQAVYVPLGHRYLGAPAQLSMGDVDAVLGPLLADPELPKVGHDVKFCEVVLLRHRIGLVGVAFDTMLASYLLDPEGKNQLHELAERELGAKMQTLDEVAPKRRGQAQRGLDEIELGEATAYGAAFADVALSLTDRLRPRLRAERLEDLLVQIELPLSAVLAEMELTGVLVDPQALAQLGAQMTTELAALEQKAREMVGHDINLASPKQLEAVLFDELKLRSQRKTKTGRSTDADVLETLAEDHPFPGVVLEHRAIAKLKGTYVDALPRLVHPTTGRIHTRWSQAVAATGRLSSQDPNLQNIPIRTELGRMIRRAFVAPPGSVIVSADYSQIELRVLAHLSKDPVLVDAFRTGQDVHVRTAMEIFGVDEAGVTDEMRRRSKTINFGVIYGMGEAALAKRLDISRAEAARFIDAYFARYRGVHEFMERTMAEAKRSESVRTLLGRRRLLPDLRSSDRMRRAQAERIAQNTPIQGTAADLLKLAMVRIPRPVVPGARMVLTVHDELAFEVPIEAVDEAKAKVREAMESVFPLDVPLVVDIGHGPTWAEAH